MSNTTRDIMNLQESQLHYPFGDTLPQPGEMQLVCPGVYWLRMKLPFALDHINVWLLEDGDGWTIIDSGVGNDDTHANWETIFSHSVFENKPVKRVLATHCHPDHLGSANWLCERWNVPLWMSATEYNQGRVMHAGLSGFDSDSVILHFQRHGVLDPEVIQHLGERKNYYPRLVPQIPNNYIRIQHDDLIQIGHHQWRVITGFGHSPEHVSLYCEELHCLISGDMLLPRISTNVSVWPVEPLSNPVKLFLNSIKHYLTIAQDTLVLPSHGKPFSGMHVRIQQLVDHHTERLAEVYKACATPKSAYDIVPLMFSRRLDTHQLTFALGEALAHLHFLWYEKRLERTTDSDGIIRFAIANIS